MNAGVAERAVKSFIRTTPLNGPPRLQSCYTLSSTPVHLPLPVFLLHTRYFGHLAGKQEQDKGKKDSPTISPKGPEKTSRDLGNERQLTVAEQRKKDWNIIKKLLVNIWPPGDWNVKSRVVLGFGLLVGGKVRAYDSPAL